MAEFFTMLGTLLVVCAIMYLAFLASKYTAKIGMFNAKTKNMQVVEQIVLSKDKTIAIVRILDTYHVVGITAGNISILKNLSEDESSSLDIAIPDVGTVSFKNMFDKLKKSEGKKE